MAMRQASSLYAFKHLQAAPSAALFATKSTWFVQRRPDQKGAGQRYFSTGISVASLLIGEKT
jgi:hypothetical protein